MNDAARREYSAGGFRFRLECSVAHQRRNQFARRIGITCCGIGIVIAAAHLTVRAVPAWFFAVRPGSGQTSGVIPVDRLGIPYQSGDKWVVVQFVTTNHWQMQLFAQVPLLLKTTRRIEGGFSMLDEGKCPCRTMEPAFIRELIRAQAAELSDMRRGVSFSSVSGTDCLPWVEKGEAFFDMIEAGEPEEISHRVLWPNVLATIRIATHERWALLAGGACIVTGTFLLLFSGNRQIGECCHCGYDLCGIPAGKPCPECGKVPEEVAKPAA